MANLITIHHEGGWVAIPNRLLEAQNLSWKAKGLWSYLQSRPEGWNVREKDLVARSKDGRDAVRSALVELEEAGWLTREQGREGGNYADMVYHLHEPGRVPPLTAEPMTENPSTDNPPYSNTNRNNTEENNTKTDRGVLVREAIHWLTLYPNREGVLPRAATIKAFIRARESGATEDQLIRAASNYRTHCRHEGKEGGRYVYSTVSFLSTHWEDWVDWEPKATTVKSASGLKFIV